MEYDEGDIPMKTKLVAHGDVEQPNAPMDEFIVESKKEEQVPMKEQVLSSKEEDIEAPQEDTIVPTMDDESSLEELPPPPPPPLPTTIMTEEPQQSMPAVKDKEDEQEEKKEEIEMDQPKAMQPEPPERAPKEEDEDETPPAAPEEEPPTAYQKYKNILWGLLIVVLIVIVVVLIYANRSLDETEPVPIQKGPPLTGDGIPSEDDEGTFVPSASPTRLPTTPNPTVTPGFPTVAPTTLRPTRRPTAAPTRTPTTSPPTRFPTKVPTQTPTVDFQDELISYLKQNFNLDTSSETGSLVTNVLLEEAKANGGNGVLELTPKLAQRFVLLTLGLALNKKQNFFDVNARQGSWGSSKDECDWEGITCENARVVKIKLGQQDLNGRIPSEIGLLSRLRFLDLADNRLMGSLPEQFYNLTALRKVYLYKNRLTGTMSDSISNLWDLKVWNLSVNRLSGSIPSTMRSGGRGIFRIETFNVYDNQMTGTIPANLKWRNNYYMDLGRNKFSGTLPVELGTEFVRLRHLHLDFNRFSGRVASQIINAGNGRLLTLSLNDNQFTGALPGDHMLITELNQFTVQNNQFTSMGERTCMLNVLETGELPEFKSDCDICVCGRNNQMCRNCYK